MQAMEVLTLAAYMLQIQTLIPQLPVREKNVMRIQMEPIFTKENIIAKLEMS